MAPSASFIDVKHPIITRPAIKKVSRAFSELPQSIHSANVAQRVTFNPCMHLNFHSRNNLYNGPNRAKRAWRSPHAATEPFPLFTQKAIAQSSAEIFDEEVIAEYQYSSTFDKHMVRGVGPACIFPIQPHLTSTPNTNRRVPFKYDS